MIQRVSTEREGFGVERTLICQLEILRAI